jgi:S-DNA-T family DNA segregation ATPase FtsK/SpoIIIE
MTDTTWRRRVTEARSKPESRTWRQAVVVVPLVIGGLYAAVAVAGAARLPWEDVAAAAGLAAFAAVIAVASVTGNGVAAGYAAVCGAAATGWVLYVKLTSPWTLAAAFALLCPALFLGAGYPVVRRHHDRSIAEAKRRAAEARQAAEARKWPDLLARIGAPGVTLAGSVETRAGHVYRLRLPPTGKVTFSRLERLTEALETAARLRDGAVRFERGDHAGEVLMHVAEKDILALTVPYPGDLSDLTVNRPFRIGTYEDGSVCEVLYREVKILVIGLTGSGKSNLINVLIAQLGRCVDTVIFMIDQKGGRAALPWIQPWLEGKTARPVIDWVATNRDESERMLDALLRGIDARAHSGAGGEKITPTAAMPAIVLVIDEMAVIFGAHGGPRTAEQGSSNTRLAGKGTQIVQLGRSEAIDAILATQRGTATMTGGGDLKSQCRLRIGLGVASENDARMIIPDDASVARVLPKLKHPGSGIVSDGDAKVAPVKFDRLEPGPGNAEIHRIAAELGDRRPEPDSVLTAAFGEDYALRWTMERAGHIPGFAHAAVLHGARAPGGDEYERRFSEIVAGAELAGLGQNVAGPAGHPARRRMLELLERSGVMGITPNALGLRLEAEGLDVTRQAIAEWLAAEQDAGRVVKATYGRWKSARHG